MAEKKTFPFAIKSPDLKEATAGYWKILIVDDEEEVHVITRAVLRNFSYDMYGLQILSAYSGAEAKKQLTLHNDIALILLDVVMECDDAGLEVARYIREEIKNNFIQIILRTGQPGSAPEQQVIRNYEINDYKEKTELTSSKLHTTVLTALRAYKNIRMLEKNRLGLEKILNSTKSFFNKQSEKDFLEGVLIQIEALLRLDSESSGDQYDGFSAFRKGEHEYEILASTGSFQDHVNEIPKEVIENLDRAAKDKCSFLQENIYVGYFCIQNPNLLEIFIYFQGRNRLTYENQMLVEIYISKAAIALENMVLAKEILDTKREIINMLGNVLESRSKETANHVQRVAAISYYLAKEYGLNESEATLLKNASPLHDVGKIGIEDNILLKPSRLDAEEYERIKQHTTIGYDILKVSDRDLIKAAATIAHEHHERWDGTGYPRGLARDAIHIYGRITAIADVFDALYHKRCYKELWRKEEVYAYFLDAKGKQFDPTLTEIFLENFEEILQLESHLD